MCILNRIFRCVFLTYPVLAFAGGNGDTGDNPTARQLMQHNDFIYLHNVESGNINPASLSRTPIRQMALIEGNYLRSEGDFHAPDHTGISNGFSIGTFGIKCTEKMAFEGSMAYTNLYDHDRCWNSSLYLNPLNPFILADSLPSGFSTEKFTVKGRLSMTATPRLRIGINACYNVGVTSDEQDPRVETKGMRFILNPGIGWDITERISIGATGGIDLMNETSRYSCVGTAVVYRFFLMSGLGTFYPASGTSYQRDTKGTSWFAGGNVRYDITDKVADNLSVIYHNDSENATDGGSSYQFRGGDFSDKFIEVNNRLAITGRDMAHNIELHLATHSAKGKWFEQQSVTVNGSTQYEIMSTSVKHTEKRTSLDASYRLDLLATDGTPTLTAMLKTGFMTSDTKNYPDLYKQKYTRLDIAADVTKHLSIKKATLGVGIGGGYSTCPSSESNFAGLTLAERYTRPMYDYLTASAFNIGGHITLHIPIRSVIVGASIEGGNTHCTDSGNDRYNGSNTYSLRCGLSLIF